MKYKIKRILAIVMALAVIFSLSVSAFAAATPSAVIDYGRKGSIQLYKYDMTTAAEDGVWNTESYVSTGLTDEAVEAALNPYAVQGVEFSYLRVADIVSRRNWPGATASARSSRWGQKPHPASIPANTL